MPPETRMGLKFKQDLEMGILLSFRQGYQDKCDRLKAAFGLGGFPLHSPPPPRLSAGYLWGQDILRDIVGQGGQHCLVPLGWNWWELVGAVGQGVGQSLYPAASLHPLQRDSGF